MKAWHFTAGPTLANGDGRPIVVGETLTHKGPLVLCRSGLHASVSVLDALEYAPGPWVWRVDCGGEIVKGDDKLVCSERTALWGYDATAVLRKFARMCALDVLHLWPNPPDVVVRYLKTGDETIRYAAMDAARDAARYAARCAARDAARDAARCAARCAARDAARDAAWDAQRRRLVRMLTRGRP